MKSTPENNPGGF